jgi:hypothetical protein
MSAPPVYAALMSPGSALHTYGMVQSFRSLAGFGVLIDTTSPENRLVLDERGEPRIQYKLSEDDKLRFRQGICCEHFEQSQGGSLNSKVEFQEDGRPRVRKAPTSQH